MHNQGSSHPPAHLFAGALSIVLEQIERNTSVPDGERRQYITAAISAFTYLINNGAWERDGAALLFPSRSRESRRHRCTSRHCSCAAALHGRICFHRPARKLIELVEAFQCDLDLPPGRPPAPPAVARSVAPGYAVVCSDGQPAA